MSPSLKTIKYIVESIQWHTMLRSKWWFFSMHAPYIITCLFQTLYKPHSKNLFFNSKVYDGMNRNHFKYGLMYEFLYKLKAIKRPKSYKDAVDGRGYFIGYEDDED